MTRPSETFIDILHSDRPASDRAEKLGLYAFLVGSWETTVVAHEDNGATHTNRGEIHAGWVLEGRALQDVWMLPGRAERQPDAPPRQLPVTGNWYGTTLRIYDPGLDAWRILWSDPATNFFTQQTGRARGADIVQTGPDPRGGSMRWVFSEIQPDAFHWTGERAPDDRSWRREVDIRARRT